MEDNRTDITIHQIPISVSFICPHCEAEIDINFNDFTKVIDDFPYWIGRIKILNVLSVEKKL